MYYEVIWLGRGGQGAVTASRLLAKALAKEGIWAQAIVFFGAERRGAPVYAYNRISNDRIKYHHFVYKADVIIVFEPSLIKITGILEKAKDNATILINYAGEIDELGVDISKYRVAKIDATSIALDLGLLVAGIPVINTAMIGAFARVMGFPSIKSVEDTILEAWSGKIGELNAKAAKRAYEETIIVKK